MEVFHKILKAAVDGGSSDVHLKPNTPIIFRISRRLVSVDGPPLTVEWMENVVNSILPKYLHQRYEDRTRNGFLLLRRRHRSFSYQRVLPTRRSLPRHALCQNAGSDFRGTRFVARFLKLSPKPPAASSCSQARPVPVNRRRSRR